MDIFLFIFFVFHDFDYGNKNGNDDSKIVTRVDLQKKHPASL